MTLKKLGFIIICVFLLTIVFSGVSKSASEEAHSVYDLDYGGLTIDVWAPYLADPGQNINVTVKAEAVVQSIYIEYIEMDFCGVVNSTTEVIFDNITLLEASSLSSHEIEFQITIPSDISPGLIYGKISCEWDLMGATFKILPSGFPLTYVKDLAFEELQTNYEELNATYQSTLEDYNQVESKFKGEADSSRNLMYVFIATTVVASITVGILLIRKPKKVWV